MILTVSHWQSYTNPRPDNPVDAEMIRTNIGRCRGCSLPLITLLGVGVVAWRAVAPRVRPLSEWRAARRR